MIARVAAIFMAWPLFARALRREFKKRGRGDQHFVHFDRFFEWTPGKGGDGHPHFHVWLWSPWICHGRIRELWTEALRAVGVPVRVHVRECASDNCRASHVEGARAWVQHFRDFDARAVNEIMKNGRGRSAIELARFESDGGGVLTYAAGWALADVMYETRKEVLCELYCVLEGRRLAQSSKGFYAGEPDACCPFCKETFDRPRIYTWSAADEARTAAWESTRAKHQERGPPS